MNNKRLVSAAKWCLSGVIICGLSYSIATLTAIRAYADDSCTPAECQAAPGAGQFICNSIHAGTFKYDVCPWPGNPDRVLYVCSNGSTTAECANPPG
jgi:hypothetical protein